MSIINKIGDITTSDAKIICHQVNCQGKMNSGVAKVIRDKWPEVYNRYRAKCESEVDLLGQIQPIYIAEGDKAVINMFAQYNYGYDGRRYTSYDAFWSCLGEIKKYLNPGITIAFPARIGCVRGGANWTVIKTMIEEVLSEDFEIEFWDYDKG